METDLTRASITEQLHEIPLNTHLECYGDNFKNTNYLKQGKYFYEGKLVSVDWENKTLILYDTANNSNDTIDITKISHIVTPKLEVIEEITPKLEVIEEIIDQLKHITIDKYLRCWGKFTRVSNSSSCNQGKLVSVDWENKTLILYDTANNSNNTIDITKISYIETQYDSSGASGAAQKGNWHKNSDNTYTRTSD